VKNISHQSVYLILEYDLQCHKIKMSESEDDRSRYVNAYEMHQTLKLCKMQYFPFINNKKVLYMLFT
jgi:hypothetical protein